MGRIDDALRTLDATPDATERALHLAGLVSTLFKIKGVVLVVTNQLAYDGYANTSSAAPEVDLAALAGALPPRDILDVMRGQLRGRGSLYRWVIAGVPVRFETMAVIAHPDRCREFSTGLGVIKLMPVEEIAADYILAAHHPEPDPDAHARAHLLLVSGLADVFQMDWTLLYQLCHRPTYRVGEELARMRIAAKRDVDAMGLARDHVGETTALPKISASSVERAAAAAPAVEVVAPEAEVAVPAVEVAPSGAETPAPSVEDRVAAESLGAA